MDKSELARLKELAEKAMPGPWELDETPTDIATYYEIYSTGWMVADCEKDGASAAFIAAANPATILALIAEIESLQPRKWACEECGEVESELRGRLDVLEKEVDWLAERLLDSHEAWETVKDWREQARKAVEGK